MATNVTLYKVLLPAAKLYRYFAPIMAFVIWSHALEEVEQTEANLQYGWVQYSDRWKDTVSKRSGNNGNKIRTYNGAGKRTSNTRSWDIAPFSPHGDYQKLSSSESSPCDTSSNERSVPQKWAHPDIDFSLLLSESASVQISKTDSLTIPETSSEFEEELPERHVDDESSLQSQRTCKMIGHLKDFIPYE